MRKSLKRSAPMIGGSPLLTEMGDAPERRNVKNVGRML